MKSISSYVGMPAVIAIAAFLLAGCGGDISKAKNKKMGDGPTYQVILEDKLGCKSVEWSTFTDKQDRKFVKASCLLDQTNGFQREAKQREEQRISFAADQLKMDYDALVNYLESQVAQFGNSLAMAAPGQEDRYKGPYEDFKAKLQQRLQQKAAFYAAVDAGRNQDLGALEDRFGDDSKVSGDFIFIVGKDSAQLDGLQISIGGKTSDVPPFDVVTLLMAVTAGDKAAQAKHWGSWIGSKTVSMENLTKLQVNFISNRR